MSNTKSILAAGVVTSLVILALVGLNLYNHRLAAQADAAATTEASDAAYLEALTSRQGQLDQAVTAMEARQDGYVDQIDTANQTVEELETTIEEMQARLDANNENLAEYEPELQALNNTAWSLRQTRDEWAAKEADYTTQIEAANAQIVALQAELGQ